MQAHCNLARLVPPLIINIAADGTYQIALLFLGVKVYYSSSI
jgi:hypothetical protein